MRELSLRRARYLWLSKGQLLLLPGVVDRSAGVASVPPLELGRSGGAGDRGVVPQQSRYRRAAAERHVVRQAVGASELACGVEGPVRARPARSARIPWRPAGAR